MKKTTHAGPAFSAGSIPTNLTDNLARLCKLRDEKAEELGMEGSFLITRASLEAIAEDREKGISTLLNWQKEALGF